MNFFKFWVLAPNLRYKKRRTKNQKNGKSNLNFLFTRIFDFEFFCSNDLPFLEKPFEQKFLFWGLGYAPKIAKAKKAVNAKCKFCANCFFYFLASVYPLAMLARDESTPCQNQNFYFCEQSNMGPCRDFFVRHSVETSICFQKMLGKSQAHFRERSSSKICKLVPTCGKKEEAARATSSFCILEHCPKLQLC